MLDASSFHQGNAFSKTLKKQEEINILGRL